MERKLAQSKLLPLLKLYLSEVVALLNREWKRTSKAVCR